MRIVGTLRMAGQQSRVTRFTASPSGPSHGSRLEIIRSVSLVGSLLIAVALGSISGPAIGADGVETWPVQPAAGPMDERVSAMLWAPGRATLCAEDLGGLQRLPSVVSVRRLPASLVAVPTEADTVPFGPGLAPPGLAADSSAENQRIERLPVPAPASPSDRVTTSQAIGNENQPIDQLTTDVRPPEGRLPEDVAAEQFGREGVLWHGPDASRPWTGGVYQWEPSALYHRPLYFEEVNVERHGHRVPVAQPVISAAHFFATVPALPYLMALDPPHRPVYDLGHCRPGSVEACPIRRFPVLLTPSVVEAAVVVALCFAIP